MAQSGSAPGWGPGGRRFKSCLPDLQPASFQQGLAGSLSTTEPRCIAKANALEPLPPGRYLVKFRVLSVDGHIVEDQFPFTIKQ